MMKQLLLDERKHGVASTYLKYKCRCAPCVAAVNIAYKKKNEKRRAKREKAHIGKLDATSLIEFLQECPPEIRDKYKNKFGGWTSFGIDAWTADRICIEAGTHPVRVFGQYWIDKALEGDVEEDVT